MRSVVLVIAILLLPAIPARAQFNGPLPVAVLDIRGFYSGLGQDPTTAADLGVDPTALPKRGLGGVAGLNFYLLRGRKVAIGLGAEGILARGRAQQKDATTGAAIGDPITQHLRGVSGVLSLNFGHRDGWSYVSAGMGPLAFSTRRTTGFGTAATLPPPMQMTLNVGAGARWFARKHLAFGFDFRIYQTQPESPTVDYVTRQRTKLTVLSAGISIK